MLWTAMYARSVTVRFDLGGVDVVSQKIDLLTNDKNNVELCRTRRFSWMGQLCLLWWL